MEEDLPLPYEELPAPIGINETHSYFDEGERAFALAFLYENNENYLDLKKAFIEYQKAINCYKQEIENNPNHTKAYWALAYLYEHGKGEAQNLPLAAKYYEKSAELGDSLAQFKVSHMYDFGKGVEKDTSKAIEWLEKAANSELQKAQYNLGVKYYTGKSVPKDLRKAAEWFEKASKKDDDKGLKYLALYNLGKCIRIKDKKQGIACIKEAAQNQCKKASNWLSKNKKPKTGINTSDLKPNTLSKDPSNNNNNNVLKAPPAPSSPVLSYSAEKSTPMLTRSSLLSSIQKRVALKHVEISKEKSGNKVDIMQGLLQEAMGLRRKAIEGTNPESDSSENDNDSDWE